MPAGVSALLALALWCSSANGQLPPFKPLPKLPFGKGLEAVKVDICHYLQSQVSLDLLCPSGPKEGELFLLEEGTGGGGYQ